MLRSRALLAVALLAASPALSGCLDAALGTLGVRGASEGWPTFTAKEPAPPLPPGWADALDASAPVLEAIPWGNVANATDPIAFGNTFAEFGNRTVREFALAAIAAQSDDGGHPSIYYTYGHPAFNGLGERIRVSFTNKEGVALAGEIQLPYGAREPPRGRYPAIVAFEGLNGNVESYRWWHALFASHGFIVLAFDFTGQGHSGGPDDARNTDVHRVSDATRAIDYLVNESPVAKWVDASRIGTIGHSMGAITVLQHQEKDARVKAAVAAAPINELFSNFTRATIPIQIQSGDHDGPVAPLEAVNAFAVERLYAKLTGDAEILMTASASHGQHISYPLVPTPSYSREIAGKYALAWMERYLKSNDTATVTLTSADPHLSAFYTSAYRVDNRSGRLAGALPPSRDLLPLTGTLPVRAADGRAWLVTFSATMDAGMPHVDVRALPTAGNALPIASSLVISQDGHVVWRLVVADVSREARLV